MKYPEPSACISILEERGLKENVLKHVKAVHRFAVVIGSRLIEQGHRINMDLLEAGALLHDIGRTKSHKLDHAVVGCKIAAELGFPDDLINIIRNHIGAGIYKKEAAEIGLPYEDYIPETIEQKIVAAADNLALGHKLQTIEQFVNNLKQKGVTEGAERSLDLHMELSEMCGIDLDELLKIKADARLATT